MLFLAVLGFGQLALAASISKTKMGSYGSSITKNKIGRRLSIHLTNGTTGSCDALIEETDWAITNLAAFQADPSPDSVSYVQFSFEDVNPGLGLKTNCSNYLPRGSNGTVANDKYHPCDSDDVQFMYSGQTLQVERWYQDPCLGPAPYDSAVAHGRSNITFTKTQAEDGVLATQVSMNMPITSLS